VVLSAGATASALLASTAFPGLYAPVAIAGRTFIDGGVSADIPVLQAEQLGATETYVLPAALSDDLDAPLHGPMALAYRALGQLLDAAARRDTAAATGPVHVLPAPISAASTPIDFRDTSRLIAEGHHLAAGWLAVHATAGR
jgi:NTE family protein